MLLPLKPICERKDMRRDGTSLVYIQYCYSSEHRTNLNTEIAIPPDHWVKKTQRIANTLPESFGDFQALNEEINRMYRMAEDIISFAIKNNIADRVSFVKKTFTPKFDVSTIQKMESATKLIQTVALECSDDLNVFDQIDNYIKSKQKKVSDATIDVYRAMKHHLQEFQTFRKKKITFASFDYAFYEDFIDFLTFDYIQKRRKKVITGLKLNSIGKTIKHFRGFIKDRVKRKIIASIDLSDYKVPEEESDAIYLSYEEIEQIYHTDLAKYPFLVEYRDLFVLACLTGLRFSDFSVLRPEDLRNDMLYKKQEKSDHWVVIPLREEAKLIFTEQFREKIPDLTNPEFNRHIKTIGKLSGIDQMIKFSYKKGSKSISVTKRKFDWITSHTARRSFCTNEFLAGTPVKLIMKISGHKNEKDFYKYIRITPEEAAQKIKELWLDRDKNMKVFKNKLQKAS